MKISIIDLKNNRIKEKKEQEIIVLKKENLNDNILNDLCCNVFAELKKIDSDIIVKFNYDTKVEFLCNRCLKKCEKKFKNEFESSINELKKDYEEMDQDIWLKSDNLDINKLVNDDFYLNFEAKLCNIDCKGLCSECGINLNENSCNCNEEYVNPTFAKLKDLFKYE